MRLDRSDSASELSGPLYGMSADVLFPEKSAQLHSLLLHVSSDADLMCNGMIMHVEVWLYVFAERAKSDHTVWPPHVLLMDAFSSTARFHLWMRLAAHCMSKSGCCEHPS